MKTFFDELYFSKNKIFGKNEEFKFAHVDHVNVFKFIDMVRSKPIKTFEKVNGVTVPYKIVDRREGDIEKVWADPSYANNELGWTAKETVEETLRSAWVWEQNLAKRIKEENCEVIVYEPK